MYKIELDSPSLLGQSNVRAVLLKGEFEQVAWFEEVKVQEPVDMLLFTSYRSKCPTMMYLHQIC